MHRLHTWNSSGCNRYGVIPLLIPSSPREFNLLRNLSLLPSVWTKMFRCTNSNQYNRVIYSTPYDPLNATIFQYNNFQYNLLLECIIFVRSLSDDTLLKIRAIFDLDINHRPFYIARWRRTSFENHYYSRWSNSTMAMERLCHEKEKEEEEEEGGGGGEEREKREGVEEETKEERRSSLTGNSWSFTRLATVSWIQVWTVVTNRFIKTGHSFSTSFLFLLLHHHRGWDRSCSPFPFRFPSVAPAYILSWTSYSTCRITYRQNLFFTLPRVYSALTSGRASL